MMNQLKYWKALLLLCGALVLISCSSGQTGDTPTATTMPATMAPTMPASQSSTLTPGTANLPPLSMQQAWGNIKINRF